MATAQAVWGIDVGRCALKAIKLRKSGDGKVELLAHDYVEHAKILTQPDAERQALISSALEKFLSHNDLSKDQVVVSVPGQHTLARFTKLPPVAPKRIPDIVQYEAEQQIPFDMDEVIWDYQTFQQEGTPDLEVGIFAMKRELIREHLLHFEQAAIEPMAVQSAPLAVYNAAHFDGVLTSDTTILLDLGAENTDLIIATPDSFWTRTVPKGGNSFTEALVKSFKLSFSKAEALKRTAASSKYARQIFQAMRPVFADLVQELQRSIGFYSSTHRDANVERVIAVGNAFLLPGLQKYLQQNLGMPVERPDSFKNADASSAPNQEGLKEQLLSYAVAYGLALQGLEVTKVNSNLLPTEIAMQAVWRKKRLAFAASAACILLAGGLVWFRQASDMSALAASSQGIDAVAVSDDRAASIIDNGPSAGLSDRAQAEMVVNAGSVLRDQLAALTGQGANERGETEKLIELQRNKTIIPQVLALLHNTIPRAKGAMADAESQAEMLEVVASGQAGPRDQRTEVVIESMDITFEPNVKAYSWDSVIDVPEPINSHDVNEGDDLPGLLVKIICTTPNAKGATYIRDSYMRAIRESGRKPGTGFYVDHIIVLEGSKVGGSAGGGPIGMRGGSIRGGGRGGLVAVDPRTLDVVTNEPIGDDWRFEIWADVILEDFPQDDFDDSADSDEG